MDQIQQKTQEAVARYIGQQTIDLIAARVELAEMKSATHTTRPLADAPEEKDCPL